MITLNLDHLRPTKMVVHCGTIAELNNDLGIRIDIKENQTCRYFQSSRLNMLVINQERLHHFDEVEKELKTKMISGSSIAISQIKSWLEL